MRRRFDLLIVLCAIAFMLLSASSSQALKLEPDTMMFGGQLSLPLEYNYKRQTILRLEFRPEYAYFVLPNFSVGGGVSISYAPYDSARLERPPVLWSFHVGFRYYFDLGNNFFPFTGFYLGLSENDFALVSLRWGFDVPIGVLWALNEHVGLIFGAPVKVQFKTTSLFEKVVVSPGYFGVLAFF